MASLAYLSPLVTVAWSFTIHHFSAPVNYVFHACRFYAILQGISYGFRALAGHGPFVGFEALGDSSKYANSFLWQQRARIMRKFNSTEFSLPQK